MRGFTLVEVAVVLAVIGVLVVAMLQGRQLIENARYKSLMRDIGDYREAFEIFKERYNALPGDYVNADDRFTLSAGTAANGDGNGVIGTNRTCDGDTDESCLAWQHLRGARLINGDKNLEGTDAPPEHAFGGRISAFFTDTDGNGEFAHKLLIEDVPSEFALRMDEDLDDGDAGSGWISRPDSNTWPDAGDGEVDVIHVL